MTQTPSPDTQAGLLTGVIDSASGIVPATPVARTQLVGINKDGQFYLYGDSGPGPVVGAVIALKILDLTITTRGATSRYGERDYLDVRMASPTPDLQLLLCLPCSGSRTNAGESTIQHSVRSLLGALITLDLTCTAVKLQPKRGHSATFIEVLLDPIEYRPVIADSIGPTRTDLEAAVDRCRANLGLEPQFPSPH